MMIMGALHKELDFPIMTMPSFLKSDKNLPIYAPSKIYIFSRISSFSNSNLILKLSKMISLQNAWIVC